MCHLEPDMPSREEMEKWAAERRATGVSSAPRPVAAPTPAPEYQSPSWLSILFTPITWGR